MNALLVVHFLLSFVVILISIMFIIKLMQLSKRRFVLTSLLFWGIMSFTAMIAEGVDFFAPVFMTKMPFETFVALGILDLICLVIYLFFEAKRNGIKPNYPFIIIGTLLLFTTIIGIWYDSGTSFVVNVQIITPVFSVLDKVIWTITFALGLVAAYIMFVIYPKGQYSSKRLVWFYYAVILVGIISIIYSLSAEFRLYASIFSRGETQSIESFYNNENTYSAMLMLALLATFAANFRIQKWWNYILMVVFFAAMLFATSLTCIALSVLFIFFYYSFGIVKFVKQKNKKWIIIDSVVLGFFTIALLLMYFVLGNSQIIAMTNFKSFIDKYILLKDYASFGYRQAVWDNAIAVLTTPMDWIFGKGYQTYNAIVSLRWIVIRGTPSPYVDSGYVQLLGTSGIIGLLAYSGVFGYLVFIFVKLVKNKRWKNVIIPFGAMITIAIHGIFETTVFFDFNTKGMVITAMFVLPLLIEYNDMKNPELKESIKTAEIPVHRYFHSKNFANLFASFSIALAVALAGSSFILLKTLPIREHLFAIFICGSIALIALFLTLPFLIRVWTVKMSGKILSSTIFINALALVGMPALTSVTFGLLSMNLVVGMVFFTITLISILLLQILIYGARYDYLKEYAYYVRDMLLSTVVSSVVCFIVYAAIMVAVSFVFTFSILFFVTSIIIFFIVYLCSLTLLPNHVKNKKKWRDLLNFYNDVYLKNLQVSLIKNDQKDAEKIENGVTQII